MEGTSRILRSAIAVSIALPWLASDARAQYDVAEMVAWATWVEEIERGPLDAAQPALGVATWGTEADVLGPAEADTWTVVSLGDGGFVTLGFDEPIGDGPGDDLAVFENGFYDIVTGELFGELAFVEVSTNGIDFARFATATWNPDPVAGGGVIDPADYEGFAGIDPVGLGTGFDLAELAGHPLAQQGLLDLQDVAFVRVVDAIGDGSTRDDAQQPVYDPYPTVFANGGFDLDGIGVLNVPEPRVTVLLLAGLPGLAILARRRQRRARRRTARRISAVLPAIVAAACASGASATTVVGFEDLGLAPESAWNGSDGSGGFHSGPVFFENVYVPSFSYWYGFAASTTTDTTTPGFGNQYSAIPGSGVSGSATYAVFFDDAFDDPRVVLPTERVALGFHATNTTYTYLSMRDGDAFAKQFGGPSGDDPDWFTLTISGYDAAGVLTGTVDFDLADFRFADGSLDYIVDEWTWVDLTSLGAVKELGFALSSSDTSGGFLNTPGYFAMDGLTIVPEPGTAVLVGVGLALLAAGHRR